MFFRSLFFISVFSLFSAFSFANECTNLSSYSCFQQNVTAVCKNDANPWKSFSTLGAIDVDFPQYDTGSIQKTYQNLIDHARDDSQKAKIQSDLSPDILSMSPNVPIIEFARKIYQSNMNAAFSCAIVSDRADQLKKLGDILNNAKASSEIQDQLKKEQKKYEVIKSSIKNCDQNGSSSNTISITQKLAGTTMTQYCTYSHYLDYIDANMKQNYTASVGIDQGILGKKLGIYASSESVLQDMTNRQNSIQNEMTRAENTLPKALMAYREMQRTYSVHILLVMITDDYLTLRSNLDLYLSNISQLFEKAHNAQDANQR